MKHRPPIVPRRPPDKAVALDLACGADAHASLDLREPTDARVGADAATVKVGRGPTPAVRVSGQYLCAARDLNQLLAPLTGVPGASVSSVDQDSRPAAAMGLLPEPVTGVVPHARHASRRLAPAREFSGQVRLRRPAAFCSWAVGSDECDRRTPIAARLGRDPSDAYGGAINRLGTDATASVHRDQLFAIQYVDYGGGARWLATTHAAMRPHASGYAYQDYIDADLRDWRHAYYGSNYTRAGGGPAACRPRAPLPLPPGDWHLTATPVAELLSTKRGMIPLTVTTRDQVADRLVLVSEQREVVGECIGERDWYQRVGERRAQLLRVVALARHCRGDVISAIRADQRRAGT